jgi:ribonuclease HI
MDSTIDYYVYTDGACSKNGSASAIAGIGVFFGEGNTRNVSRRVEGKQTNNTAELTAIREAYLCIEKDLLAGKRVCIVSDSQYAIWCATSYGEKCAKKGWKDDIPNKELVKEVYELVSKAKGLNFLHVRSHTGAEDAHSIGNDWADKLANLAIGVTERPQEEAKIYLNVSFALKDTVKHQGGKWDAKRKKWYILATNPAKEALIRQFGRVLII